MKIKVEPVRLLSITVAGLTALLGATQIPVDGHPLLPPVVAAWCAVVVAVLTAVGGELARGQVTSLAAPKDAAGVPLVPVTMTQPADHAYPAASATLTDQPD